MRQTEPCIWCGTPVELWATPEQRREIEQMIADIGSEPEGVVCTPCHRGALVNPGTPGG